MSAHHATISRSLLATHTTQNAELTQNPVSPGYHITILNFVRNEYGHKSGYQLIQDVQNFKETEECCSLKPRCRTIKRTEGTELYWLFLHG